MRLLSGTLVVMNLMACGMQHDVYIHQDKPLQVQQTISIDLGSLNTFFTNMCNELLPNASQQEVNACVGSNIEKFLNIFTVASPTGTPSSLPSGIPIGLVDLEPKPIKE